jgi:hypothetical protein
VGLIEQKLLTNLINEASELVAIFTAALKTLKQYKS